MHQLKTESSLRWKYRFFWLLIGLGVSLFVTWLLWGWIEKARWITGQPDLIYDRQPDWLLTAKVIIGWIPLASVPIVVWLRLVRGPRIKVFTYCIGLALPYLTLIGMLTLGPTFSDYIHREQFDSAVWKLQEQTSQDPLWPPRLRMVDDLMESGHLNGLSEPAVIELLGPPQEKGFPLGVAQEDIHYYLGPERGLIRIDSEWLVIRFNLERKVDRYWIYRD